MPQLSLTAAELTEGKRIAGLEDAAVQLYLAPTKAGARSLLTATVGGAPEASAVPVPGVAAAAR